MRTQVHISISYRILTSIYRVSTKRATKRVPIGVDPTKTPVTTQEVEEVYELEDDTDMSEPEIEEVPRPGPSYLRPISRPTSPLDAPMMPITTPPPQRSPELSVSPARGPTPFPPAVTVPPPTDDLVEAFELKSYDDGSNRLRSLRQTVGGDLPFLTRNMRKVFEFRVKKKRKLKAHNAGVIEDPPSKKLQIGYQLENALKEERHSKTR